MRWAHESNKRLVEAVGLPVGLRLPPVAGVPGDGERNFMATEVLCALIRIATARSRRAYQSQTQSSVVRFVRGVLAIGEHRHTIGSISVGEVDPLVRGDFELPLLF